MVVGDGVVGAIGVVVALVCNPWVSPWNLGGPLPSYEEDFVVGEDLLLLIGGEDVPVNTLHPPRGNRPAWSI